MHFMKRVTIFYYIFIPFSILWMNLETESRIDYKSYSSINFKCKLNILETPSSWFHKELVGLLYNLAFSIKLNVLRIFDPTVEYNMWPYDGKKSGTKKEKQMNKGIDKTKGVMTNQKRFMRSSSLCTIHNQYNSCHKSPLKLCIPVLVIHICFFLPYISNTMLLSVSVSVSGDFLCWFHSVDCNPYNWYQK